MPESKFGFKAVCLKETAVNPPTPIEPIHTKVVTTSPTTNESTAEPQPADTASSNPIPNSLTGRWERTNPGGGGAFAAVGAGPTGVIIAASDLSGAYRSLDNGQRWDVIGSERGLFSTHVSAVGFDPNDGNILYLGTDFGLYRSGDGGETVSQVLADGYIEAVAIAASNSQIGYAAYHPAWNSNEGTIYKTADHGLSWQRISNSSLPTGLRILKLIVDPSDSDVVYLLAGEGRFACGPAVVYESVDGGSNWTRIASDLGQIMDMALDPNDVNKLYLTTYGDVWDASYNCITDDSNGGYLYRGDFSGDWTWTQVTNDSNLGKQNAMLWLDQADSTLRLIDIDYPELFESTDDGATWEKISEKDEWDGGWAEQLTYFGSFNGDAKTLGVSLANPDMLLWVDDQFVYATLDDGRTFAPLHTRPQAGGWQSTGVDNIITFDIAIHPADSNYVFLAMPDLGCFRSTNGGASWLNCNKPELVGSWQGDGGNSMTVAVDPTEAGVVWITMADQIDGEVHTLVRSTDYGATWQTVWAWEAGEIPAGLAVDPDSSPDNRTLYLTVNSDVWSGQSSGTGWTPIFDCNGCRQTAVLQAAGQQILFAGGEAGLWRSVDGGATWDEVGTAVMRGDLDGVFWDKYWAGVADIVLDPHNPDYVYAAVFGAGRGLYRSTARGEAGSWEPILADDFMRSVAVSPRNPNLLLATSSSNLMSGGYETGSGGVWMTENGRDGQPTWLSANEGLAWPFANSILFDPNDSNTVWLGSPGAGYHKRNLGAVSAIEQLYLPLVVQ
ncbi:MAG: hypothetical protein AAF614_37520 [Chloroflexota bacterium]